MSETAINMPVAFDEPKPADDMDLLGDQLSHDAMDADPEPTEEAMMDAIEDDYGDAINGEDLDMDGETYDQEEDVQDIDLRDAGEATETVTETGSITAATDTGKEQSIPVLGTNDAAALKDYMGIPVGQDAEDMLEEQGLDEPDNLDTAKYADKEEEGHALENFGQGESIRGTTSEEYLQDFANDSANQQTPKAIVPHEPGTDGLSQDQDLVAEGSSQNHEEVEVQGGRMKQQDVDGEGPSKVSTHNVETVAHYRDDHDLSSKTWHLHPITILFQGTEMSLFTPADSEKESSGTFLLEDVKLANKPVATLFQACRSLLGESIEDYCELEMHLYDLQLTLSEAHVNSATTTLRQLVDVYLQLKDNDGVSNPAALYIELSMKPDFSSQLLYLQENAAQGKGLTECVSQEIFDKEAASSSAESHVEEHYVDDPASRSTEDPNNHGAVDDAIDANADDDASIADDSASQPEATVPSGFADQEQAFKASEDEEELQSKPDNKAAKEELDLVTGVSEKRPPKYGNEEDLGDILSENALDDELNVDYPNEDLDKDAEEARSSAGSSTLQGEVIGLKEDASESLELPQDANELYVDENGVEDFASHVHDADDFDATNDQSGLKQAEHGEVTHKAEILGHQPPRQHESETLNNTQGGEKRASGPQTLHSLAGEDHLEEEAELDVVPLGAEGLDPEIENAQGSESDGERLVDYRQEADEEYNNDDLRKELDPSFDDTEVSDVINEAKDKTYSSVVKESQNLQTAEVVEDLLDEEPDPTSAPNDVLPKSPGAKASTNHEAPAVSPNTRKRSRQREKEEFLIEDFELTPKRIKST